MIDLVNFEHFFWSVSVFRIALHPISPTAFAETVLEAEIACEKTQLLIFELGLNEIEVIANGSNGHMDREFKFGMILEKAGGDYLDRRNKKDKAINKNATKTFDYQYVYFQRSR